MVDKTCLNLIYCRVVYTTPNVMKALNSDRGKMFRSLPLQRLRVVDFMQALTPNPDF